ncbi:MAG: hypothetical protein WBI18_07480 [Candidatus Saccharicenans sp.]
MLPLIELAVIKRIARYILIYIFVLLIIFSGNGLASSSAIKTFTVEIKEWLVLEINTGIQVVAERGSGSLTAVAEVKMGQPVMIKALLSAGHNRTVVLRGKLQALNREGINQAQKLFWSGNGDLSGSGLIYLNKETTFAVWRGQGYRAGSLNFYSSEETDGEIYLGVFYLSAI